MSKTLGQIIDEISDSEYKRFCDQYMPYMKEMKHLYKDVDFNDRRQVLLAYIELPEDDTTTFESKDDLLINFFDIEPDKEPVVKQNDWRDEIKLFNKTERQKQIDKLEHELEKKTRELIKLRQEEKEWQEEYKKEWNDAYKWNIDNYKSGSTVHSNIKPLDQLMTDLYRQPFDTKISFISFQNNERQLLGERLKQWYEKEIEGKRDLKDRIVVDFWLLNGEHKRRTLIDCEKQIKGMFDGNYVFSVDEITSGIDSDETTPFYMSMFTSIVFKLLDKPVKTNTRDKHESGFFPYRLTEKFKDFAPLLERYQIYYRMNQSDRALKESNTNCFVHVCKLCGVDNETAYNIAKFTDDRRYIGVNELTEISNAYPNVCFRVRKISSNGRIQIMNEKNKQIYGKKTDESIVVEICEYEKHYFVWDDNVPVNLFYIKNFDACNEYADKRNMDFEQRCMFNKFHNKTGNPRIDKSKCKCNSFKLITTLMENGAFEPIKASDDDFKHMKINMKYIDDKNDKLKAKPLETRETKLITTDEVKTKYTTQQVYYGDFETCKHRRDNGKDEALEFMICVQSYNGTIKKTYVGKDCGQQMLNDIPDNSLIYFHNLGFDGRLLMKYGVTKMIRKGSKIMSMNIKYANKKIELRDSYSMFSQALATFPSSFPKAFANTNIHKELFPYDYYTYERIYEQKQAIGNINDAINIAKWNDEQAQTFKQNLVLTKSMITDETFDMLKYCEFYCTQDVNVLRIGFNAFREAALDDPINLDVFNYLTAASLAGAYMNINVFGANGNLYKIAGNVQKFIQQCVYGGRCMTRDNKRWYIKDKLDDFDACSLYPSAMARLFTVEGMPEYYDFEKESNIIYSKTNLPWIIKHAFTEDQITPTKDRYISQFFVHISIKEIGINRHFPLIVKREKGKQTNCNECVDMYVDLIALEDLIKYQDIKFTILEGYIMKGNRDISIRTYIRNLFNKRAEFKKSGNPVQQVIKLIMNSAYGKTIQKPIKTSVSFMNEAKMNTVFYNDYYSMYEATQLYNSDLWLVERLKMQDRQFNNAVFGVSVLSMSKRIMNEVMCLAEDLNINIYYQDTDSMHIEHDKLELLANEFKRIHNRELIGENTIGCFHNDFDELKDAYCVEHISCGKKIYCDVLKNDKGEDAIHFRMKGAPQKSIIIAANERFNGSIRDLYMSLYNGDEIDVDLVKGGCLFSMTKYGNIDYNNDVHRKIKATCERNDA